MAVMHPKFTLTSTAIRRNSWLILKISIVIALTAALFLNDLSILFNDALQNEETSYMLLVPFILGFMLYRKRKMLRATMPIQNTRQTSEIRLMQTVTGLLTIATATLLYWYGSYTFTPIEYHMATLPIFTAGMVLVLFNLQTLRQLFFPIAFLIFLMPVPSEILYTVGSTLSVLSSEVSSWLAQIAGIPSTLTSRYGTPAILITQSNGAQIPFIVDIACSGVYALLGFLVFAVLLVYLVRDRIWKKLTMVAAGILLVVVLNVARIIAILGIGYQFGETFALQVFHILGTWFLTFIGTLLLLPVSEKVLKTRIFEAKKRGCQDCDQATDKNADFCFTCGRIMDRPRLRNNKEDLLKIAATATIVVLFLSIQAPVFAITQTPANILISTPTGQTASTAIFPEFPNYTLRFSYRDTTFEKIGKQDMSLMYIYYPKRANLQPIWIGLEIASTRSPLHRWEICLVTTPLSLDTVPTVTQIELTDMKLYENPPIIGREFVFQKNDVDQTQAVLYWYETGIFNINSTSQQMNVKISLIGYPRNAAELEALKNEQLSMAKILVNYWEPIKIWSAATMMISTNGAYLAAITSFAIAVIAVYYSYMLMHQREINKKNFNKLSTSNRQIVDAIQESSKKTFPTLNAIATEYQKATGQPTDRDRLLQTLKALEKEHVIESRITNHKDEPIQTWKA